MVKILSGKKMGRFTLTKAQAFTMDFFIALVIFAFIISFFIIFQPKTSGFDFLQKEADSLSETLLSEGIPRNWTIENVIVPGIAKNNRIDNNKLNLIMSINYNELKNLLSLKNDFYVEFESSNYSFGRKPVNAKNLASISRVVILESNLTIMRVEVYEEK